MVSIKSYFSSKPAPASAPAPVPAPSPAPEWEGKQQDFIDALAKAAKFPTNKTNKEPIQARRVAVYGRRYYWGDEVSHPMSHLPKGVKEWCTANGYTNYNSILVNVYDDEKHNIGWHKDDTKVLASGEVISVSFAMHRRNRKQQLAKMEFRFPDKTDSTGKKKVVKSETIVHGTAVRFDAFKHKRKQCEHRVAKTLYPRVNLTLRLLKV